MSKRKKTNKADDDAGYPFDTGDWAKWTNRKRLAWMVNLRDKLTGQFKGKYDLPDEKFVQLSADIGAMEKVIEIEETDPRRDAGFAASPPAEQVLLMSEWLDDLSANRYEKARIIGLSPKNIEDQRDAFDKWEREMAAWQKQQDAAKILGRRVDTPAPKADDGVDPAVQMHVVQAMRGVDDTKVKAAFESGDEEAGHREFEAWIAQLQAIADRDPIFAKWFEDFRADQERLLRWDETIDEDDDRS